LRAPPVRWGGTALALSLRRGEKASAGPRNRRLRCPLSKMMRPEPQAELRAV
jgi:hypothetical protein